jgi:hypothetical protein
MGVKDIKETSRFHLVSRFNVTLALLKCWQKYRFIEMEGSRQAGKRIVLANPVFRDDPKNPVIIGGWFLGKKNC